MNAGASTRQFAASVWDPWIIAEKLHPDQGRITKCASSVQEVVQDEMDAQKPETVRAGLQTTGPGLGKDSVPIAHRHVNGGDPTATAVAFAAEPNWGAIQHQVCFPLACASNRTANQT